MAQYASPHAEAEPIYITKNGEEDLVVMSIEAVSYTHLDVYKRQRLKGCLFRRLQTGLMQ